MSIFTPQPQTGGMMKGASNALSLASSFLQIRAMKQKEEYYQSKTLAEIAEKERKAQEEKIWQENTRADLTQRNAPQEMLNMVDAGREAYEDYLNLMSLSKQQLSEERTKQAWKMVEENGVDEHVLTALGSMGEEGVGVARELLTFQEEVMKHSAAERKEALDKLELWTRTLDEEESTPEQMEKIINAMIAEFGEEEFHQLVPKERLTFPGGIHLLKQATRSLADQIKDAEAMQDRFLKGQDNWRKNEKLRMEQEDHKKKMEAPDKTSVVWRDTEEGGTMGFPSEVETGTESIKPIETGVRAPEKAEDKMKDLSDADKMLVGEINTLFRHLDNLDARIGVAAGVLQPRMEKTTMDLYGRIYNMVDEGLRRNPTLTYEFFGAKTPSEFIAALRKQVELDFPDLNPQQVKAKTKELVEAYRIPTGEWVR
jgi:hypothetical protein